MNFKNLKMNKKGLLALLVAGGICLGNIGNAEIFSYNRDVTLKDGDSAKIYFSKNVGDVNYAYISSGNMVGFVYEDEVIMDNVEPNNYFIEDNSSISVITETAYLYQTPDINDTKVVGVLHKNDVVDIMARSSDGWYVVYTNGISGFMHESSFIEAKSEDTITMAKVTKNNVNVRYSATTKQDNIIGFADVTDTFRILGRENNWYIVDYLGQTGYIREDFIREIEVDEDDYDTSRIAYLEIDSYFYTDLETNDGVYLPAYQSVAIIREAGDYYKVKVDGVVGYVLKRHVKKLTRTCVVVDLSRQILKVYKNGNEVFRAHIISGRQSLQTQIGCFKIGHKVQGYQLTPDNYVQYWIQFDDNRGLHDASWQSEQNFTEVAHYAYEAFAAGRGKTFPYKHGSHGCGNMKLEDIIKLYGLVSVSDNVLVMGPNIFPKSYLISMINHYGLTIVASEPEKIKKLV